MLSPKPAQYPFSTRFTPSFLFVGLAYYPTQLTLLRLPHRFDTALSISFFSTLFDYFLSQNAIIGNPA
jgi:hypothetical protein